MKIFDLHIGLSDFELSGKTLPNQFNFDEAKKGGLDIFLGMMCPTDPDKNIITKHLALYEKFQEEKLLKIVRDKKRLSTDGLKTILGIEGVYFIKNSNDLPFLKKLINNGIRIVCPQWNLKNNLFTKNKLNKLGKEFLSLCEKEKITIDLAHANPTEFNELIDNFGGRIINSHTAYAEVFSHKRNIGKEQAKTIIQRNGLIGLCFVGEFLGGNKLENVSRHIFKLLDDFGENNICIGSDFDGMEKTDLIENLEDVSKYNILIKYLLNKGMPKKTLGKIFHENAFNFFLLQLG